MLARLPIEIFIFLTFISVMSTVKLYLFMKMGLCVFLFE